MKMPHEQLILLVPKDQRKEARKLLKEIIKLELISAFDHIQSNVNILTGNADHYREFSVVHDSDVDGG